MFTNTACSLPDGVPDRVIFTWGWWSSSSCRGGWWLMWCCQMFSNKGSSASICPCYPSFQVKPHIGCQKCKQWGIIPLLPGTLGQYKPLALGLVSLLQAWVSWAGGYLGTQTTQIETTSNLINIYWQLTSYYSSIHGYRSQVPLMDTHRQS